MANKQFIKLSKESIFTDLTLAKGGKLNHHILEKHTRKVKIIVSRPKNSSQQIERTSTKLSIIENV